METHYLVEISNGFNGEPFLMPVFFNNNSINGYATYQQCYKEKKRLETLFLKCTLKVKFIVIPITIPFNTLFTYLKNIYYTTH